MEASFHSSGVGAGGAGMDANFFSSVETGGMGSAMRARSFFSALDGVGTDVSERGFVDWSKYPVAICSIWEGFARSELEACSIPWIGAYMKLTCKAPEIVDER